MLLYIVYQLVLHVDQITLGAQQHMVATGRIAQLEEEFGLAGVFVDHLTQFGHHLVVEQIGRQRDGDAIDGLVLHRRQVLYVLHLQIHDVAVAETGLQLCSNVDGGTLGEHAIPPPPVLPEESQLARTVKVLDGDKAAGFATLGEL